MKTGIVHQNVRSRQRPESGITLLELLVVLAIVGILLSVAYPSYMQYVTRSHRTAAKFVLLQVADRQEQLFGENKQYTANLTDLGYVANTFMINENALLVADGDNDRIYALGLTNTSAVTFTVNAAPQLRQARHDTQCQTLTLAHTGLRGQTGASTGCW